MKRWLESFERNLIRGLGFEEICEIMRCEIHVKIIFVPCYKNVGKCKFLARIVKVIK